MDLGGEEDPEEEDEEPLYNVRVLRFGETDEENLEDFGVVTNNFDLDLEEELVSGKNNVPILLYVVDSKAISSENIGKSPHSIHHNIIVPAFTSLKGYMKIYIYDCQHPKVRELKKAKHATYVDYMKAGCDKKNKAR
jgi:hypothetical protein